MIRRLRQWFARLSLAGRLLLATLAPLVLVGAVALSLGANALFTAARDQALERQAVQARVAAAGLYGSLKGYLRLLRATAAELALYGDDVERQQRVLWERSNLLAVFSGGVGLLNSGGNVVAVTPPARASLGMNFAFRYYFRAVSGTAQSVLSSVFAEQPSGESAVVVAVPVEEPSDRLGVLAGQFLLRQNDWVREPSLLTAPPGGVIYLLDSAGNVIYHSDATLIGRNLNYDEGLMGLVAEAKESRLLYQPVDGEEARLRGFAPIGDTGWFVVVEEPWSNLAGDIARYQWAMAGVGMLVVLLAGVLLAASARLVVRPLDVLVTEGKRVQEGSAFRPLPVGGPPDVQALLKAVNGMVARLDEQQAALREYARQVVRGQEEERLRLSRDLHDETVQDLVALNQRLDLLRSRLQPDAPTAAELAQFQDTLIGSIASVRRLSNNLRPHVLEDLGLSAALRALAHEVERQLPTVRVHCEVVGEETSLPAEAELTVYRIAQEALTNVRKHAPDATRVSVELIYAAGGVELVVQDDGPGFDVAAAPAEGHLGLAGMRERAQLFGGRLEIESAAGQGTTVLLRLPTGD